MKVVKVFVAVKRRLMPGDKKADDTVTKAVSKIAPQRILQENGKPVDIV